MNFKSINRLNVHNNLCQPRLLPFQPLSPSLKDCQRRKPICRFFLKPDGCKNGDNCQYAHPRTHGKCLRCGSESHNLRLVPVLTDKSLLDPAVQNQHLESPMPSPREEQLMPRLPVRETKRRRKLRVSLKAKDARLSLQPRVVASTLTRMPRLSKRNLKNLKGKMNIKKMIQKLILQKPNLLLRVRWTQTACLIGLLASASITNHSKVIDVS